MGCLSVFIGLESVNVEKRQNEVGGYRAMLRTCSRTSNRPESLIADRRPADLADGADADGLDPMAAAVQPSAPASC